MNGSWKKRALGTMALCATTSAAMAATAGPTKGASVVVLMDVAFRGVDGSTVTLVKDEGVNAVAVDGAKAAIDFEKIVAKAKKKAALSSCTFVMRAVDAAAHRVELSFDGLGVVDLTETDVDARVLPKFAGSKTFAVEVYRDGKLVDASTGVSKPIAIAGFDAAHDGAVDALGFDLTFGKVRKDAWSVTLTHEHTVVVLTPEGVVQSLASPPSGITVQTTAVEGGFVLVREAVTVSPL